MLIKAQRVNQANRTDSYVIFDSADFKTASVTHESTLVKLKDGSDFNVHPDDWERVEGLLMGTSSPAYTVLVLTLAWRKARLLAQESGDRAALRSFWIKAGSILGLLPEGSESES